MPRKDPEWKKRYRESYEKWFRGKYPQSYRDHGLPEIKCPRVNTSNGLTQFVVKFLTYEGYRATRINVEGRLVQKAERQPSGITLQTKKWQSSSTRRGTADVSSTIRGRSVMWEIKIGNDKPSEFQLLEQERERKAGGLYEFIKTPEDFFVIYDQLVHL